MCINAAGLRAPSQMDVRSPGKVSRAKGRVHWWAQAIQRSSSAKMADEHQQDVVCAREPPLLRFLLTLERVLRAMFYGADAYVIVITIWAGIGMTDLLADPPDWGLALLWYLADPVCAYQLLAYMLMVVFALYPECQSLMTFATFMKYVGVMNTAGPYDVGATVLGARRWDCPWHAGLPHARQVFIKTPDDESLGAWHVLPAVLAPTLCRRVVMGENADTVFDAALGILSDRNINIAAEVQSNLSFHGFCLAP